MDNAGNLFVSGLWGYLSNSSTYPLTNPGGGAYYQPTFAGGLADGFIMKFNNLPTVDGPFSQTLCIISPMIPITHTTSNVNTMSTPSGLPPGVTANFSGNTLTISGAPTATGAYNYSIPLINSPCGCDTVYATGTITVNNCVLQSIINASATTICEGDCVNYSDSSMGNPTSWNWVFNGGIPTSSTNQNPGNVCYSNAGTYTTNLQISDGTNNTQTIINITVNPNNTITLSSAPGTDTQTVCVNTPMTNITYSTTGATGATFSGFPTGVNGNFSGGNITISGTPTAVGTFNYTVTLIGGCGTVTATGIIMVNPNNTVILSSAPGTDTQTVCVNTPITNITYSTTGATGASFSGLPTGVSGNFAGGNITISGTPNATGTFNYTITLTGGCDTVTASGTITVEPENTVTGPLSDTLCVNAPITPIAHTTTGATGIGIPSGLPPGINATWSSNTITISGTPTTSGVYSYTIPLIGGCGNVNATGTITVMPENTVTGPLTDTLCLDSLITPLIHITTGATGIGTPVCLPPGLSASFSGNTITISGTPTVLGVYTYSIPLTGGCGNDTATGTITVEPENTVTGPLSDTLCVNAPINPIVHTSTGATGMGVPSGLPPGINAIWSSNTITISGTPTSPGVYNYTIPLTGGCGNVYATGSITVDPCNIVSESSNPYGIRVYPNPMKEYVIIEHTHIAGSYEVEITNTLGAIVKQVKSNEKILQIERSNLAPAMYYYSIRQDDKVLHTGKLLIE